MRTKHCRLVLAAVFLAGLVARAQETAPPAQAHDLAAVVRQLGVDTNKVELISFDSEFPLDTVIKTLASQSKLTVKYAPELTPGGQPAPVLNAPVGNIRLEKMTSFEALLRILRQNSLVLGRAANSPDTLIGSGESKLTPLVPEGDLDKGPAEESMEAFAGLSDELPLPQAILMLARFAKIPVLMDPKLKTGGEKIVGTNVILIPPITTNTVNLGSMQDLSAKQRLQAILNVHELAMLPDPSSQIYTITYKDPGAKEPKVPNVVPLRYSNTTNIQTLIAATFPNATFQADTRTASLLVLSTEKDYDAITNLVAQLDTPTRQVLIEARFLETLQNPRSVKGIDWTDTLQGNRVTFGNGRLVGDSSSQHPFTAQINQSGTASTPSETQNNRPGPNITTSSSSSQTRYITEVNPSESVLSLSKNGFNTATAFLNADGVNAVLSMLNADADTRTLATPRAVALDNQETKLEVTRSVPIFDASEQIGQGGSTIASSKPTYTNVGTILIVTPRISGTNVAMRVRPEISRVEATPSRKVVAGRVNEADIFAFNKIDTQVIIPSGNTLVMGGLISDSSSKTSTKVPILGDVPLLGRLFRHESQERRKGNLIIFVTPTIVYEEDFQPYRTDFLNTKMPEHPRLVDDPSKSTKPVGFGKKARAKAQADAEAAAQVSTDKVMEQ